ncbi:sensor histidine kinase [Paenibacillus psychroresistens]|nr:histidine kinase [Paenibacillus psychroresistens]
MLSWINKQFREKFFNRILLTYTIIISVAFTMLAFIILHNIMASARNDALNYNEQVNQQVKSYMDLKSYKVKQILQQLYLNQNQNLNIIDVSGVFHFLENKINPGSLDYYADQLAINKYFRAGNMLDEDIMDILIWKSIDTIPQYFTNRSTHSDLNPEIRQITKRIDSDLYGVKLIPSLNLFQPVSPAFNDKSEIFSIAANIHSESFEKNLGYLLVNFSTKAIIANVQRDYKKFDNRISVLTYEGVSVFDSSGESSQSMAPYFADLRKIAADLPKTIKINDSLVSVSSIESSGILILSIIPGNQIYQSTTSIRNTIIFLLIICLTAILTLSYFSMSVFSKRIKEIIKAMNRVKKGDLSVRVVLSPSHDEISLISNNFNTMVDNLSDYINRSYVSDLQKTDAELKQRTAELYALQSQINPHFLYNTLESIRMKALTSGNQDVSKMIRILANLFRSNINKEMFVQIQEELDYCEMYLELFHIRYRENLQFTFDIDHRIAEFAIIRHLLQPLIENSILHGIDITRANNHIRIHGKLDTDILHISVSDNGLGISEAKLTLINERLSSDQSFIETNSIGIINVNQRIKLIYGKAYGLQVISKLGSGTQILVKLPAKTKKELEAHVQGHASG